MVLLLPYNTITVISINAYVKINKATGENNTSIHFIRWGVEPHIVKAHKHNSVFLISDALKMILLILPGFGQM